MARLLTTRESRVWSDTSDPSHLQATAETALGTARRWLATHPRPRPTPGDPFLEDLLAVTWQTEYAHGVIWDPWTQLEGAIAGLGTGENIANHIWLITYITGRAR